MTTASLLHLFKQTGRDGTTLLLLNRRLKRGAELQDVLRPVEDMLLAHIEEDEEDFFPMMAIAPTVEYAQRLDVLLRDKKGSGKVLFAASNNLEDRMNFYAYIHRTRAESSRNVLVIVDVVQDRRLLEAALMWRVVPGCRVIIVGIVHDTVDEEESFLFEDHHHHHHNNSNSLLPYCYAFFWPRAQSPGLRIGAVVPRQRVKLIERSTVSDIKETDLELTRRFIQDVSEKAIVYFRD